MEWGQTEQRNEGASEGDTLAEEMRDESILRQLTYTSVMLVVGILDPHKGGGEFTRPMSKVNFTKDQGRLWLGY